MEDAVSRSPRRSACADWAKQAHQARLKELPPLERIKVALQLRALDRELQRRLGAAGSLGL